MRFNSKQFKVGKYTITHHSSWWVSSLRHRFKTLKPYKFKTLIKGWEWGPFMVEEE